MEPDDWVVLGHHGTTRERADAIFDSGFKIKQNHYDWLGHGVYFFERAPVRAKAWAEQRFGDNEACVVAADIALNGNCWDFGDLPGTKLLEEFFEQYLEEYGINHVESLKETFGNRELTCRVINYACTRLRENNRPVYVLRAPFEEGRPIFSHPRGTPTAKMRNMSHVQIAVRDCRVIREPRLQDG